MRNYPLFFCILICSTLFGQKRNVDEARSIAFQFLSQHVDSTVINRKRLTSIAINSRIRNTDGKSSGNAFHIFADTTENFSVIISGDYRMKDILAFCPSSDWSEHNIPDALHFLMQSYEEQYESLNTININKEPSKKTPIPTIEPLLKTEWDQSSPFNDQTPDRCPAGCVAIAMSQIMNYYKYPLVGKGSFSYISKTNKYRESYNFSQPGFSWNDIKDSYSAFSSSQNKKAVANLVYGCGVSVGMDYTYKGSGAYLNDVPYALISFWNYNNNTSYRYRPYYDSNEWYNLILNELRNKRPVLYGGVDASQGGHAFVIDGCSEKYNKFHVNWGWGGEFDGYYELEALDPNKYSFSSYQDMIVNFSPEETGIYEEVFYANSFMPSGNFEIGHTMSCVLSDVYCYSSRSSYVASNTSFSGIIGIALFDSTYTYKRILDYKEVEGLRNFYGYKRLNFDFTIQSDFFDKIGIYYIAPVVIGNGDIMPSRIRTLNGDTDFIKIFYSGDGIDNPVEDEKERLLAWSEDFENNILSDNWRQKTVFGKGGWTITSPILPSEKNPVPFSGKRYVSLSYDTSTIGFDENRIVSYLESDYIPLSDDYQYTLSFYSRCFCNDINPTNTLTVYYENQGKWEKISTLQVLNQGLWMKQLIKLPTIRNLSLRIEGSLSKGSNMYLDLIEITSDDETTSMSNIFNKDVHETYRVYNLEGQLLKSSTRIDHGLRNNGLYIIKDCNGKSLKILRQY